MFLLDNVFIYAKIKEQKTKKDANMNRLTDKNIGMAALHLPKDTEKDFEKRDLDCRRYMKLRDLEDIEEELGVDLLILFKALKDGIYAVVPDYEKPCIEFFENYKLYLDLYSKLICIRDDGLASVAIKYYGKTWALTKEELKNE